MDVAFVISQRLSELGLGQRDLARAARVTESYISQLLARKRLPPAPARTDIYPKMDRVLKLPIGELARVADLQRKDQLKKTLGEQPTPLFREVRELILAKCDARRRDQLSAIFEMYWDSPQAYPIAEILGPPSDRQAFDRLVEEGDQMRSVAVPPLDMFAQRPIGADFEAGQVSLAMGKAIAFADPPGKVMATSVAMAQAMSVQMNIMDRVALSNTQVVISSPYFVPGADGVQVGVVEPGDEAPPSRVDDARARSPKPLHLRVAADGHDDAVPHR